MTCADLMSLLMCFFVLPLSFSEIDARRFKQIAGELAVAFGVQREVPALEVPMGTSAVFKDFSPGKPEPTLVDQVRQQTTTQDPQVETNTTQNPEPSPCAAEQQLQDSARELREALAKELQNGQLQMEEEKRRIILRVEEKGSFPSGSAELTPAFEDMLDRMAGGLTEIPGELTIEGHTDNVPISTLRFLPTGICPLHAPRQWPTPCCSAAISSLGASRCRDLLKPAPVQPTTAWKTVRSTVG